MKEKIQQDNSFIRTLKIFTIVTVMLVLLVIILLISLSSKLSEKPVIITISCVATLAFIFNIICVCIIACSKWNIEWMQQKKKVYAILSIFTFGIGEILFVLKATREIRKLEIEINKQSKSSNKPKKGFRR